MLQSTALVACRIGAAYWFTVSPSFANLAAGMGRMISDSFAEIAPSDAVAFVLVQCVSGAAVMVVAKWLGRTRFA